MSTDLITESSSLASVGYKTRLEALAGGEPDIVFQSRWQKSINPSYLVSTPSEGDVIIAREKAYTRLLYLMPNNAAGMNQVREVIELRDTRSTLKSALDLSRWCITAVSRGKIRPHTSLGAAANAYLTYLFGVKPTIESVRKFRKECAEGALIVQGSKPTSHRALSVLVSHYSTLRNPEIISMESNVNEFGTWVGYHPVFGLVNRNFTPPTTTRLAGQSFHSYKGCYFAQLTTDVDFTAAQNAARRFIYRCPIAGSTWDLLPWTFLYDWFITIGDQIKAIERRFLTLTYGSYLGPIWHSAKLERMNFLPRATSHVSLSHIGEAVWNWDRTMMSREVRYKEHTQTSYLPSLSSDYSRGAVGIALGMGVLSLERPTKLYQLSAGMALITKFLAGSH